ncbi:MAG: universal stress protein [Verrucomicrobiae bacterium]|nr:universal stress protein [Verrucomicrobiae bacterium]
METPHDTQSLEPLINSIFLPTDFSPESHAAFAHALRFAAGAHAKLSVVHVRHRDEVLTWEDFPHVRETLERWGNLPQGSRREDLWNLGFDVQKVVAPAENPVKACLDFLEDQPAELIVLTTHHTGDGHHWFGKRIAEPIAQGAGEITLFLPAGRSGFVSLEDGSVSLKQILIPVDSHPDPQRAVDAAVRTVATLQVPAGEFTLYHCGAESTFPRVDTPEVEGWEWDTLISDGHAASEITKLANEIDADLIVMASEGRHGFLDAFRGSTTERVLHQIHCPLAVIPAFKNRH